MPTLHPNPPGPIKVQTLGKLETLIARITPLMMPTPSMKTSYL